MTKFRFDYDITTVAALDAPGYDCVVVICDDFNTLAGGPLNLDVVSKTVQQHRLLDSSVDCPSSANLIACASVAGGRLVYCPTGPLDRDYDDVRRFQDAATKAITRALATGCSSPIVVVNASPRFPLAKRVAYMSVLHALYQPLEFVEAQKQNCPKVQKVAVYSVEDDAAREAIKLVLSSVQSARTVYCDIGGSDPERMSPPKVAEYVLKSFEDTCIKVDVVSDEETLTKEYPLLMAVNRANRDLQRQTARVINLNYECTESPIDTTLLLVGKGVTYDTGGADIKYGGAMMGMHRDKCGSAFVASFFKLLSHYKPRGLKVIGAMCMVKNSIGPDSYLADEIYTSRAGVRIRIGNTDAEGRMAMSDVVCHMKERAAKEVNPCIYTIATLTGHVIRAYGMEYAALCPNGPAIKSSVVSLMQNAGDLSGEPLEHSKLRRDDYEAHRGKSECEDVVQAETKPSTMTDRGHQKPAAFIIMASGLEKNGNDSKSPIPFCHVDVLLVVVGVVLVVVDVVLLVVVVVLMVVIEERTIEEFKNC